MDARHPPPLECDCGSISDPGLGTVEALARLRVRLRRRGEALHLVGVPSGLLDLLAFVGIDDLLRASPVEVVGEPEEREEMRGVQEEADPGDPILRHIEHLE